MYSLWITLRICIPPDSGESAGREETRTVNGLAGMTSFSVIGQLNQLILLPSLSI